MSKLTARQRAVIELVCRGKTNIEIGMILDIAPTTAKHHVEAVGRKLGSASREYAISLYLAPSKFRRRV